MDWIAQGSTFTADSVNLPEQHKAGMQQLIRQAVWHLRMPYRLYVLLNSKSWRILRKKLLAYCGHYIIIGKGQENLHRCQKALKRKKW